MNGVKSILIVVGIIIFVAALMGGTWLYMRRRRPSKAWKVGAIALCAIVIAATLAIAIYAWPKAEYTLSGAESAALQHLYAAVTGRAPNFSDSLQRQDGNQWNVGTWHKGDSCGFINGAYHVKAIEQEYYSWCIAEVPLFGNFALQVQMTILTGNGGGIVFRALEKSGNYYYFGIGQDGTYSFYRFLAKGRQQELQSGSSARIKTGLKQVNLVGVIARGSNFYLFVNKQPVAEVNDPAYQMGQIGLAADEDSDTTEVSYTNAQVWTL